MKKEYETLEMEIKNFAVVDVMYMSDIEFGGDADESDER